MSIGGDADRAHPISANAHAVAGNMIFRMDASLSLQTSLHHYTIVMYHGVAMALNIKNADVERLAAEVSRLTGESKTEAIRRALDERWRRLRHPPANRRRDRVLDLLKRTVWPTLPKRERGRRLTRAEEDRILGYGPGGV